MFHIERQLNKYSKITENIFITRFEAINAAELRKRKISHIIDLTSRTYSLEGITILHLKMDDNDKQDILPIIQQTHDFIEKCMADGGRILVHCEEGISRSCTVVCAWLMYQSARMGVPFDYESTIETIKSQRPSVTPNSSFIKQLKSYEDTLSPLYRLAKSQDFGPCVKSSSSG